MDDLVEWGRVLQDEDVVDDEARALAERRLDDYVALLDRVTGTEDDRVLAALLASVHPGDDYGAYETTYNAIWAFPSERVGAAIGAYLPTWLEGFDEAAVNVERMLLGLPRDPDAARSFRSAARAWSPDQRATTAARIAVWSREDEDWESIGAELGVPVHSPATEAPPADWPEPWRRALVDVRRGVVATAWPDRRDPTTNFPLVLALMEMDHGSSWREISGLLNPFVSWAKRCYPDFLAAFAALPAERADRVLANLDRVRPGVAEDLREARG